MKTLFRKIRRSIGMNLNSTVASNVAIMLAAVQSLSEKQVLGAFKNCASCLTFTESRLPAAQQAELLKTRQHALIGRKALADTSLSGKMDSVKVLQEASEHDPKLVFITRKLILGAQEAEDNARMITQEKLSSLHATEEQNFARLVRKDTAKQQKTEIQLEQKQLTAQKHMETVAKYRKWLEETAPALIVKKLQAQREATKLYEDKKEWFAKRENSALHGQQIAEAKDKVAKFPDNKSAKAALTKLSRGLELFKTKMDKKCNAYSAFMKTVQKREQHVQDLVKKVGVDELNQIQAAAALANDTHRTDPTLWDVGGSWGGLPNAIQVKVPQFLGAANQILVDFVKTDAPDTNQMLQLQHLLRGRYHYHRKRHLGALLPGPRKQRVASSHVWKFVEGNINAVTVLLAASEKIDWKSLETALQNQDVKSTVLVTNTFKWQPVNQAQTSVVGSYLYFDTNAKQHVRSGYAVRANGLYGRKVEHDKARKQGDSLFYRTYGTERKWSDLRMQMFTAFGADSEDIGDLLHWPYESKTAIRSNKWYDVHDTLAGDVMLKRKCAQRKMAAYLFELVGELLLGTDNCVSGAPGFEGPLGWFNKAAPTRPVLDIALLQ
jgi:hypothetical protein